MLRNITKNIVALGLNGGIRIFFGMIIQVVIARALGAEALGKFAVMTAYIAIFQVVTQLGLPNLLIREVARHREDASRYWWSTVPVLVLGGTLAWVLQVAIASLWGHPLDTFLMVAISGASLVPFGIIIGSEATLRGLERMEVIPTVQTIAYSAYLAFIVTIVFMRWPIYTLGWAMVGLQLVGAALYIAYLGWRRVIRRPRMDVTLTRVLLRQAPHFYGLPVAAIIPNRVGIIIIAKILGEHASGIFNAAQLLARALFFVTTGFSEALYPALSRLYVTGIERFRQGVRLSLYYGMILTAVLSLGMAASAPWLVDVVFGREEYAAATPLLRILAWQAVFFVLNGVHSVVEMAANRQDVMFYISVAKVVIFLVVLPVTTWLGGLQGAAWGMILGSFSTVLLHSIAVHRLVRGLPDLKATVKATLAVGLGIVALIFTRHLHEAVASIIPVIAYALALFALGALRLSDIGRFVKHIVRQEPAVV